MSPLFNFYKFQDSSKCTPESCRIHWNAMKDEEFGSRKLLKFKYRRGNQIIPTFCKIGSFPEIMSPLFNLYKFRDSSKSTPESCRIHWNAMNDEEFGSRKLLKLKYRRRDQIVQTFCKIGSPQKLVPPCLIWGKFRILRKFFLIHVEWTEI